MISRRNFCAASAASTWTFKTSTAQAAASEPRAKTSAYVAQLFDTSMSQQDVSRDFMIGSRCAWQEMQQSNKTHLNVRHRPLEVNGNAQQLESTLSSLIEDPNCIALSGTVGQGTARWVAQALERQTQGPGRLIQVAPWLHDLKPSSTSIRAFASFEVQIGHALKTLSVVGLKEVGVVFANLQEQSLYDPVLKRLSQQHQLQVRVYVAHQGYYQLGLDLPMDAPPVLLFMSGTPELAQFSKAAGKSNRHRYAIGMADINSQTLTQMGLGRNVPVVITQVVPVVNSALPVIREYRQALGKYFDEPPSALSLSGYISARVTQKLLSQSGAHTRSQVAALASSRWSMDMGGYDIESDGQSLHKAYVTQSMVASDGRLIG